MENTGNRRISKDDLERRFKNLQDDLQGRVENKKQTALALAGAAAVVVMVVSYLFGRRRGSRRATRVDFRR
ncbi:MAG: hypothetical protein FJW44_05060 [Actinobacteria bacterium]|nr:hypothetical protein [Actinomycetota bacterium]